MRIRSFLGPLLGAALGSFVAFVAVSAVSINAFAQQVPANCAPGASTAPASSTDAWTGGPGASGTNVLKGAVDAPAAGATIAAGQPFTVSGWAVDSTAQGWAGIDQVQIFSGAMGQGGTKLADALAAQSRPDVAAAIGNPYFAASGYTATVTNNNLPQGQTTLNFYAHSPGKGWWYRSVTLNVGTGGSSTATAAAPSAPSASQSTAPIRLNVENPAANTSFTRGKAFTINGTASDPAATSGSGISRVSAFLDDRDQGGTFLGDVTPNNTSSGEFRWDVTLPNNLGGARNLYFYAFSSAAGREAKLVVPITINDPT